MRREVAVDGAGWGNCEAPRNKKRCGGRAGEENGLLANVLVEGSTGDRPRFGGRIIVDV